MKQQNDISSAVDYAEKRGYTKIIDTPESAELMVRYADSRQPTIDKDFVNYLGTARNRFVNKVNEQKWDTSLRVEAENLLVAFDQAKEELLKCAKVV